MSLNLTFVIIGNPENRRVQLFQQALQRCGLPLATVASYYALISGKEQLERLIDRNINTQTILRFESPEKNFLVEKAIIAAGANLESEGTHQKITAAEALELEFDKGRIYYPRQWYLGWRQLLRQWGNFVDNGGDLATNNPISGQQIWMLNHPEEIIQMFDKRLCYQLFTKPSRLTLSRPYNSICRVGKDLPTLSGGSVRFSCLFENASTRLVSHLGHKHDPKEIPVPRSLGTILSYDQLREQMYEQNCSRVFVKLAHGSSASGVVAYRISQKGESAITTIERVRKNGETILYNSRKIRNYMRREEIADIVNILCREGVQVEEWLPKATLQRRPFDLRVVAIAGVAQHMVVRLGKSPMTNLHLGSDRLPGEAFLQQVDDENWQAMKQTCEATAALFPHSLYCGIDLLVYPDFCRHAVLEINAFGDLLPGITWNGMDTYTSEVKAILQRFSPRVNHTPL